MTAVHGTDDRNLIPRWREFGDAVRSGELDSTAKPKPSPTSAPSADEDELREAADAFTRTPGVHAAGDLLTQAILRHAAEDETAKRAAHFALETSSPSALRELAKLYLGHQLTAGDAAGDAGSASAGHLYAAAEIANLRAILRREPHNAVRWTDLALAQLNRGSLMQAERSMRTALGLQPANRFVLRSAVRLYVHVDQPDVAQALLERSPVGLADPWLRAAWLATANVVGGSLPSLRTSKKILDSGHFSPWHLSELAGQIATQELGSGEVKRARRTMRVALIDPTENALAQAEWAAKRGIDAPSADELDAPLTFEARARAAAAAGDFHEAATAGREWQIDQPFDPSPAIFVSYLSCIALEDFELAVQAARQGLVANHKSGSLRNNLVFALANLGNLKEARVELDKIHPPERGTREAHTLKATRGLVKFKAGNYAAGRELYRSAIDSLLADGDDQIASLAQIFWAREEILAGTSGALTLAGTAIRMANQSNAIEVGIWKERLLELVKKADLTQVAAGRRTAPQIPPKEITS